MNKHIPLLCLSLCLCALVSDGQAQCLKGTVTDVIDANTLRVKRNTRHTTVRLYGIDAPADGQVCAADAQDELQGLVLNKTVTFCKKKSPSGTAYEVHVLKGFMHNVNRIMVRKGLAKSSVTSYESLENKAREKKLGLWSQKNAPKKVVSQAPQPKAVPGKKSGDSPSKPSGSFTVYGNSGSMASNVPVPIEQAIMQTELRFQRQSELEAVREQELFREEYEPELTDVDHIEISTEFDYATIDADGRIEISLYYESKRLNRDVYWTDGHVDSACRVTGHFSNGTNTRIARSNDILTTYQDRVYIDIPAHYLQEDDLVLLRSCTVDCRISAGIFDLKASDKFDVYFRGRPTFN